MTTILNASTSSGLVVTADNSGVFAFQTNGTQYNPVLNSGTSQASTSGTAINFTGIPSYVKRILFIQSGVSTSGTSLLVLQIGSGSYTTSGYVGSASGMGTGVGTASYTNGFGFADAKASGDVYYGISTLTLVSGNIWVYSSTTSRSTSGSGIGNGGITLSGTLDRIRLTATNGTDTFTAGSINIFYE